MSDDLELGGSRNNDEQIDYWNVRGGAAWVPLQDRLDAMLRPFGVAALDAAGIGKGQRVLDVGCGCGDTTLDAASRTGPSGHVVGLDVSAPMLSRARARAGKANHVRFVEADAQTTDIASLGVDHVVSRFGVMFFADPAAAFANLRTAARSGGSLSFVCWQSPSVNPWFSFAGRAVGDLVTFPPGDPDAPGPFSLHDHQRIAQLLFGSGWSDVQISGLEVAIDYGGGGSIEELTQFAIDLGPIGRAIEDDPELDEPVRARLHEAIAERWSDGHLVLDASTWVVSASA